MRTSTLPNIEQADTVYGDYNAAGPPTLDVELQPFELPTAYAAHEATYESDTQARFNQWLGKLATAEAANTDSHETMPTDSTNILEMLRQAKAGSREALQMVDKNVSTAVIEVCFKNDHITKVSLDRNANGELIQFGQTMHSVHHNAIKLRPNRHPKLQAITQAEALNGHRIENALHAGKLKDYYFVVASLVPAEVPEADLGPQGDGYFLDELTFVLQATTEEANGEVTTASAFMAGVEAEPDDNFETRLAKRHDIAAVTRVYQRLGITPPTTAVGFLSKGLYIPKSMMPNGVVDPMRWCDEATDEVLGRASNRTSKDYIDIIEQSKQREASLNDIHEQVRSDMLAAADSLQIPMETNRLMWRLIKDEVVKASLKNKHINPKVLGRVAEKHVLKARQLEQSGDGYLVQDSMRMALVTATITGCGGGAEAAEQAAGHDQYGSLEFKCPEGHTNTREPGQLIPTCRTCGISVKC